MKIVTYNIQFGLGKDGKNNLERIASEVSGVDIIALQEVERYWQHSGCVDQPEVLGGFLKDYYWVYGPCFDVDASKKNPDGTISNARRQFGNMILSKTPILSKRLFPLPKSIIMDSHNMSLGLLESVIIQSNGHPLRIYNTHLSAKSGTDRISQIHHIRKIIAQAPKQGGTWTGSGTPPFWHEDKMAPPMPDEFLLLGDFNLCAKDLEYQHIIRRDDGEGDLIDTWTLTGHGLNNGVTFPTTEPDGGLRIDFAFVDQTMSSRIKSSRIDSKAQGSDHQPFWIEMEDTNPD